MWVSSSNLKKKGGIEMKKRTFIIKVLRLIAIILLLLTLLVIAIKIWHSLISDWVSTLFFLEVTFTYRIKCSSFFILCKYSCLHTNNIIKKNLLQVLSLYITSLVWVIINMVPNARIELAFNPYHGFVLPLY